MIAPLSGLWHAASRPYQQYTTSSLPHGPGQHARSAVVFMYKKAIHAPPPLWGSKSGGMEFFKCFPLRVLQRSVFCVAKRVAVWDVVLCGEAGAMVTDPLMPKRFPGGRFLAAGRKTLEGLSRGPVLLPGGGGGVGGCLRDAEGGRGNEVFFMR